MSKGGIYGRVAEMYLHDEDKGNAFIKECFFQCHNPELWSFWGIELTLNIISYWIKYLQTLYEECLMLEAELKVN